ncbi:MAG: VWA domain-containing protein [Acidobacteriota bacterium]
MLRAAAVLSAARVLAACALVGMLFGTVCAPASAREAPPDPDLDHLFDEWRRAAEPWMLDAEQRVFDALTDDVSRDLFVRAFWRVRGLGERTADDDGPLTGWWRRFEEARQRYADPRTGLGAWRDARARVLLTVGRPDREVAFGGCRGTLRPLRLWWYTRWQLAALGVEGTSEGGGWLVFGRRDVPSGLFDTWSPSDGVGGLSEDDIPFRRETLDAALAFAEEHRCFRKPHEAEVLREALATALDAEHLLGLARHEAPDPSWVETFGRQLAADKLRLPAERVEVGFPGGDDRATLVLIRLVVPAELLRRGPGGQLFDRLVATGDIRRGPYDADRFRHVFHLVGREPSNGEAHLDVYRRMRPGSYRLRLRLADDLGLAVLRRDLDLDIPERLDGLPPGARLADLTRRDRVSMMTFPGIELRPPGDALVGEVNVEAATTGGPIARVELSLDGEVVATDEEPPWIATVDLGPTPAPHTLEAIARAPEGHELARHRLDLDPAERPLSVRIDPPEDGSTSLAIRVDGPDGRHVQRLDVEVDGQPLISFTSPPYTVETPTAGQFLRAVARLDDGTTAETVHPLGGRFGERIDVRAIEVWTTVVDRDGRPVPGLAEADFRVLEDEVEQPLARFAAVDDLPIRVSLLMDTSESMRGRLSLAAESARRFAGHVLRDGDRAAVTTFDHDLWLRVPWTGDLDHLRRGISGLSPRGGTRLFDAMVHAASYLAGTDGRRALVLLSDGSDVGSDFDFERMRREILRADVAVYPILLAVRDEPTREQLDQIARESGGRAFNIQRVAGLDAVYQQIEAELRSQYLLVYQAETDGPRTFRRLDVEVRGDGLDARSIRGYWP